MGLSNERVGPRARGDQGAALVEFAMVSVLLFLLLFGIIQFGLVLSFKQDMTRAAAEGARAGAVAVPDGNPVGETPADAALSAAQTATDEAVDEFGGSFDGVGCSRAGMDCTNISVGSCTEDASKECVFVELTYDYADNPLFGRVPLVAALMPDEVRSKSEARINE
jgi:hypothetical protein